MSSATDLLARRELLWNLTLRELRGRYKRSLLGWGWSLLNPVAFMLIYTFAFSVIMGNEALEGDPSGLKAYAFYLLCAMLPWSFFNITVTTAMGTVVANGALVRKVAFPREHLVLSTVFAGLFTLAVELSVLAVALAFFGNLVVVWIPAVLVVTALLAMFTTGFGLALSAGNVYFRDLSYLWSIVAQGLFFATPIVYAPTFAANALRDHPTILRIYNDLPMAIVARMYRNLLYDLRMPRLIDFGLLSAYAVAALLLGWWVFDRAEPGFAEEL